MKKYYLHNGIESSGPFDLEELKSKQITRETPVWHKGLENWKTATDIEALATLFIVTPPPIQPISSSSRTRIKTRIKTKKAAKNQKILGLSRNTFYAVSGILVLLIFNIVFKLLQENRSDEFEIKNRKTETGNYQYEQQQKEIEEQKLAEEAAKKAAEERVIQDKIQADSDRIIEIEKLIIISQSNLETANIKLKSASGYKVLRTSEEKKEELNVLNKKIDSINSEINQLKIESNQLKLKLEKTS